jgi:hypothetical protein
MGVIVVKKLGKNKIFFSSNQIIFAIFFYTPFLYGFLLKNLLGMG